MKVSPQQQTAAAPKAQESSVCILEVRSDPTRADVELDGKFVGSTPTTRRLKPGEYTVTIRKAGFAPWARKLAAIPDNELKITAELKKDQQEALVGRVRPSADGLRGYLWHKAWAKKNLRLGPVF